MEVLDDVGFDSSQDSGQSENRTDFVERIPAASTQFPFDVFGSAFGDQFVPCSAGHDCVNLVAVLFKKSDPGHAKSVKDLVLVNDESYRLRFCGGVIGWQMSSWWRLVFSDDADWRFFALPNDYWFGVPLLRGIVEGVVADIVGNENSCLFY